METWEKKDPVRQAASEDERDRGVPFQGPYKNESQWNAALLWAGSNLYDELLAKWDPDVPGGECLPMLNALAEWYRIAQYGGHREHPPATLRRV